jgi:hypothetical protein
MNSHVQAEVAALRQLPASASAPCYRVLLVEDNPGDADLARELLSRSPGMPCGWRWRFRWRRPSVA